MKAPVKWGLTVAVALAGLALLIWFRWPREGRSSVTKLPAAFLGRPLVAPQMVAGWGRMILVAADGTLWGWGDSKMGELGVVASVVCGPQPISAEPCWKAAATDVSSTMALKTNGTLWVWGALRGMAPNSGKPVQFGRDTDWVRIAAGASFYVAQKRDGTLWAWGSNNESQLGDGTTTDHANPVQIGSGPWKTFAAGSFHGMALAPNGTLWGWGRHATGANPGLAQLGNETNWTAVYAGEFHNVACRRDGSWWVWGDNAGFMSTNANSVLPTPVVGGQSWSIVAGGGIHTVAVGADGTLWGWGNNSYGEIGNGTGRMEKSPVRVGRGTNWVAVTAFGNSSAGLTADGTVFVWGSRVDVPPRVQYDIGRLVRNLFAPLFRMSGRGTGSPRSVIFARSAQPVPILQFHPSEIRRRESQTTNALGAGAISSSAATSSEH
jgi:alpha-tubulin suppressor-like RCC1 family protein